MTPLRWLEKVNVAHDAFHCQCAGRSYREVQQTLREIRDLGRRNWPYDTWIAASATGHGLMPHRLLRASGGRLAWGGMPTLSERCTWLNHGIIALINVMLFVIEQTPPPRYSRVADNAIQWSWQAWKELGMRETLCRPRWGRATDTDMFGVAAGGCLSRFVVPFRFFPRQRLSSIRLIEVQTC